MSDYLAGSFPQKDSHHMKSHLKLPSKKTHTIGKNAYEALFVENSKTTSWRR